MEKAAGHVTLVRYYRLCLAIPACATVDARSCGQVAAASQNLAFKGDVLALVAGAPGELYVFRKANFGAQSLDVSRNRVIIGENTEGRGELFLNGALVLTYPKAGASSDAATADTED